MLACVEGNLEAFQAVLAALDRRQVRRLWLVGNLVGYGPDPAACLRLARERCERVVAGRFDLPVRTGEDEGFHRLTRELFAWIRVRLDLEGARDGWYHGLAAREEPRNALLTYGNARDSTEIVLSLEAEAQPERVAEVLESFDGLQIVAGDGNLGLISGAPPGWTSATPGDSLLLPERALVLPGWVGRPSLAARVLPADRARYAVLQAGVATWHDVEYDRSTFEAKVRRSGIPERIQQRILSGH